MSTIEQSTRAVERFAELIARGEIGAPGLYTPDAASISKARPSVSSW